MTQFAFFDLEIYKILTDMRNWPQQAPLGVTCAAVATAEAEPRFWSEPRPFLDKPALEAMISDLVELSQTHTLVSWNGAGFDFQVLALENGNFETCKKLALSHIDLMYLVYCSRGHFLGLDKCLNGTLGESKVHTVRLNDGTELTKISGSMAPKLWQRGEYQAVLDYLKGDVVPPLALVNHILEKGTISYTGFNGIATIPMRLMTVAEATVNVDPSWMTTEAERKRFLGWIYK